MIIPYTYTILRYVHDTLSGEFINIGVILFCPLPQYRSLKAQFINKYSRISAIFPDFNKTWCTSQVQSIKKRVRHLNERGGNTLNFENFQTVAEITDKIVPKENVSLQFTEYKSGRTQDLNQALEYLYDRYIGKHYKSAGSRYASRSDEEVMNIFKEKLQQRNLWGCLQNHTIEVDGARLEFKYCLKNGVWNINQPLSFDLRNREKIMEKAFLWRGKTSGIVESREDIAVNFLIAKPSSPELAGDYAAAEKQLLSATEKLGIYYEEDADLFTDQIEKLVDHQFDK